MAEPTPSAPSEAVDRDTIDARPGGAGWQVQTGSRWLASAVELMSSMRFAIALLSVICIASVIGTVIKQNEPINNYINQFGPFWADVFRAAGLYAVYSAWWFLLILAFLVTSTTLCIVRNTPKFLADVRNYKENIRSQSLKAFHHKAQGAFAQPPEVAAQQIGEMLASAGWKVKLQQREGRANPDENGWMLAAKKGGANKIGYIAAHSAIVLVCLGGLLDGDLIVRAQTWFGGKEIYRGSGLISEIAPKHRLSENNPTFRGNLMVGEGTQSSTAILNNGDGILLQELPFAVELKKFIVEYYPTGMPRLFASDIVIHDKETGEKKEARVEVNHPVNHRGIEIYQSSFEDGGSAVKVEAVPIQGGMTNRFNVDGVIGGKSELARGDGTDKLTLEFTNLRVINVENFAGDKNDPQGDGKSVDVRKVDLASSLGKHLGAGNKTTTEKKLQNVGPSLTYKLRDAAGQAREYNNYQFPVDMKDGTPAVFLLGVRDNPSDPFRYLRVPADTQGTIDDFVRLRVALENADLRAQAVKRYARKAVPDGKPELVQQLEVSADKAINIFVKGMPVAADASPKSKADKVTGLPALAAFIEQNVPEAERSRAGDMLVRLLNGVLFELLEMAREQAKLPALEPDGRVQQYMVHAVLALSDAQAYPAPMAFMLKDFTHVQASVFQVARAPGKTIVYLGCAFLILGVFAMLYIRDRRLWVWLKPATGEGISTASESHLTMALSSNRQTLDTDREFDKLRGQLLGSTPDAAHTKEATA